MATRDAATTPAAAPRYLDGDSVPEKPSRILVADDEHLVSADLVMNLCDLGYTVVGPVADGEAAIRMARQALPDLALLDIMMPKLDGIAAAKQIFDELAIPVVIVSAYSDDQNVASARQAGVFGYLVKPARENQIRASLEIAWERFRQHLKQCSENAVLTRRLEERKLVEQAKWILVSRKGITEPEALQKLQQAARASQRKLADVAQEIVRASELM